MKEPGTLMKPKGRDPGAAKYQSTFESFVKKIAAVPKDVVEQLEAERPKRVRPKRKQPAKK